MNILCPVCDSTIQPKISDSKTIYFCEACNTNSSKDFPNIISARIVSPAKGSLSSEPQMNALKIAFIFLKYPLPPR